YPKRAGTFGRHSTVSRTPGKAVCLLLAAACLPAFGNQASDLFKQGRKAERAGRMALAYLLYSQAAALAPQKPAYWLRSQAVRTRAAMQSKIVPQISSSD